MAMTALGAGIDAAKKSFVRSDLQAMTPVYLTHHHVQETELLRALDSWSMNMISVTGTSQSRVTNPNFFSSHAIQLWRAEDGLCFPQVSGNVLFCLFCLKSFISPRVYFAYGTPPSVP